MIEYIKQNLQLLLVLALWLITGVFLPIASYLLIPVFFLLFMRRGLHTEMFIGFWFILILSDNLEPSMKFAATIKPILAVIISGVFILDRREFLPMSNVYKSFLPFYLVALIALVSSPVPLSAVQKTVSHLLIFLTVPQFVVKGFEDRGAPFFKDLVYFAITIIGISFLWGFVDREFVYLLGIRFKGVFGNPNGLGAFVLLVFMLYEISKHVFPEIYSKNENRLIMAVLILVAIMSGSRTTLASLTMFLVLSRFFLSSPLIGIIVFLAIAFVSEIVANNLVTIIRALGLSDFFRIETLEGGSGRFIAWEFAYDNVWDAFWLGKGFAYDENLMLKNKEYLNALGHQGGVHNTYLSYWLNTGVIGLFLFFRGVFDRIIKGQRFNRMALPFILVVLFDILFESWLMASLNPFTIIFLVTLTLLSEPRFYERKEAD